MDPQYYADPRILIKWQNFNQKTSREKKTFCILRPYFIVKQWNTIKTFLIVELYFSAHKLRKQKMKISEITVRLEISKTKEFFNLYWIRIKLKLILCFFAYILIPENYDYTTYATCELNRFQSIKPLGTSETQKKIYFIYFPRTCRELKDKAVYFMMKMFHDNYLIITS